MMNEQYCELTIIERGWIKKKLFWVLDTGEKRSLKDFFFKPTHSDANLEKNSESFDFDSLHSRVQALNLMYQKGWKVIDVSQVGSHKVIQYRYLFEKHNLDLS